MKLVDKLISPLPVWPERRQRVEGEGDRFVGAGGRSLSHPPHRVPQANGVPMIAGALVGVGLLGYLAGLLSFRVKSRWCRECGSTTRCPRCNVTASIF